MADASGEESHALGHFSWRARKVTPTAGATVPRGKWKMNFRKNLRKYFILAPKLGSDLYE
jgi:hypothetical protein